MEEHILLLTREFKNRAHLRPDFFSSRVSVVFSEADVKDIQGVARLKQAFDLNCPAHILCGFYRLPHERMKEFEECHKAWAKATKNMAAGDTDKAVIDKGIRDRDALSVSLIKFLMSVESSAS